MNDVNTEVVVMTPELATEILGSNTKNRNVKKSVVRHYSRAMSDGEWIFNGDCIRIDTHGVLLDGQHRLLACVDSGVSFQTILVQGLEQESFKTIDVGCKRSAGDALALLGEKHANNLSAAITVCLTIDKNGKYVTGGHNRFRHDEVIKYLNKNQKIRDFVENRHCLICPMSLISAISYLFYKRTGDIDAALKFSKDIQCGDNLDSGSVEYKLRQVLLTSALSKRKMPRALICANLIKAINYICAGKTPKNFSVRNGEEVILVGQKLAQSIFIAC